MSRIVSSLLFFMFLCLITPVNAAQHLCISKDFISVSSVNAMNLGYNFETAVTLYKEGGRYSLYLQSKSNTELWRFKKLILLKSDISPEELTIPIDTLYVFEPTWKDSPYESTAMVNRLNSSLINTIKQANRLFLTLNFQDKPPIVWEVPQNVLKEWKDLINRDIRQETI